MYDSDFNVTCVWHLVKERKITRSQTTRPSLSKFTERDDGSEFYHGSCSVTMDAPSEEGHYLVHVEVMPEPGLKDVGDFNITQPGKLILKAASCPDYVAEGQGFVCKCRHSSAKKGSPPAHVYWHHTTNPATLTVTNATRKDNGTVYRCYSEWGKPREQQTIEYTVLVAHGPTTTNVTRLSNTTDPQQHESFTCTSDEVYPSANFTWNLPCQSVDGTPQSSTCNITQETIRDKTEVVCFVSNSGLPELRSRGTFKLPETDEKSTFPKSDVLGTGIAVAVAVAVVVIGVIVCVIVVVIRRRRGRKALSTAGGARYIESPDNQNDEFEEYINECYQSADGMQIPRQVDSPKTTSPQAQDSSGKHDEAASSSHGDVYSQVLKKTNVNNRKQVPTKSDQTLAAASNAASEKASTSAQGDVYAQVLKKAHVGNHEMKKAGSASEAQMQSSSSGVAGIGKLSLDVNMTSSDMHTDGTTVAETEDEYNGLKFTRTGALEADSHYSHLK
ncbi:uncharacterized protein [Littorina saxatilis]|uniref:uncharacterized protein n=1 Tax=Littorina saxatilis TaxID=31220 RepID=UPI0038B67E26